MIEERNAARPVLAGRRKNARIRVAVESLRLLAFSKRSLTTDDVENSSKFLTDTDETHLV